MIGSLALLLAVAQMMPGMTMPMPPRPRAKATPAASAKPARRAASRREPVAPAEDHDARVAPPDACGAEHAAMGHCQPAVAVVPTADVSPRGTDLPAGTAPAPPAPAIDYADGVYGASAMAASRADLRRMHGGMRYAKVMLNLAEMQVRAGRDGYRWDGEATWGGDVDRLVVKSEGRGAFGGRRVGGGVDDAEVQALYSRAIGPYFNLQAGARYDFKPNPSRVYATLGVEGLAPYWFEVEGAVFVSDRGELLARGEAWYDQRITQRLILQPRVEVNLAAQDVAATRTGSGLSDVELGLRLRYELAREVTPYVGVTWDRRVGATARLGRAAGQDASVAGLVAGLRVWF